MLVAPGYGKDIRTFPTPPTTPVVPRSKQISVKEPTKAPPQPARSRHNSERSGDLYTLGQVVFNLMISNFMNLVQVFTI